MAHVQNPILEGFNPDPSICRRGDDYYIATSTFEWYPGVQIFHSNDLANWTLATRPLNRKSLLDLRGVPDSGGIWAPCLTFSDNQFWLVYTVITRHQGAFKDGINFLTTASEIEGPWSEPIALNGSGFDPSLFHDDDGRKYLVQMLWDHRGDPTNFAGIALQEYDAKTARLVGKRHLIFEGTDLGFTEGPHLYKRNGYYYLLTAEGGTGYGHAATLARAKNLLGPYELHPQKHILSAKDSKDHPHQKAGHGDLVDTPDGESFMVHLMSRPYGDRSVLGRETALQKCYWAEDDWLYLTNGSLPQTHIDLPAALKERSAKVDYDFSSPELPEDFQWLRTPYPERIFSLKDKPEALRLIGKQSIGSWYEQALVARRQTDFSYRVETEFEFNPSDAREFAGLTAYYGRNALYYLTLTADEVGQRQYLLMAALADNPTGRLTYPVPAQNAPQTRRVKMALEVRNMRLQFSIFDHVKMLWCAFGPDFDASILSDEASAASSGGCFTGAFVGMAASDINRGVKCADFYSFSYEALDQ